jgi:hypothetical protein
MAPAHSSGASTSPPAAHATQTANGPFMITLCRVEPQGAITAPSAPHLQKFRFFASRARQRDGGERRYLHMGYFETLPDAQKWALVMRQIYPNAIATPVPAALLQQPGCGVPTLAAAVEESKSNLTDTQVLNILETRRAAAAQDAPVPVNGAGISLLRPEDTNTRRALKEAVVRGAPVSFAVQLIWSVEPIDLSKVPANSIFRAYTMYASEGRREGRAWHCLRLGFFSDAISAKQVAYFVRSSFPSVAVVPVTEQERAHASESRIESKTLADPLRDSIDQALSLDRQAPKPEPPKVTAPPPTARRRDSLEQTLEMLKASEIWSTEESMSETGVRHLSFEIQKGKARRS